MSEPNRDALDVLIHDVNSKCASLKSAVGLLRSSTPDEARELLSLMTQQAQSLAQQLAAFRLAEGGR